MIFVIYDTTGKILSINSGTTDTIQRLESAGSLVLVISSTVDIFNNKVNTSVSPPVIIPIVPTASSIPVTPPAPPAPTEFIIPSSKLQSIIDTMITSYWSGSISVNIGTSTTPIMVYADVSANGKSDVLGLYKDFADGSTTETWFQSTGSITITQSQLDMISQALKSYVEGALAVWQEACIGINATPPTITTIEQIKALSWPTKAV